MMARVDAPPLTSDAPSTPILFETERLSFRDFDRGDVSACWAMWGDPEVMRFLGGVKEKDEAEMAATLERVLAKYGAIRARGEPLGAFAMIERASGELVGCALFKRLPDADRVDTEDIEIGWHLARRVWGRGYATEAGLALRDRAFTMLPIDELHAVVDDGNERSSAVARRLGLSYRGITERYYGRRLHHFVMSRAQWEAR
jgi:ribosomal-protein-alanine N-acetyltransferase